MLEVEQGAKILNFDQNFMMSQIEYRILKLLFVGVLCASFVVFFSFGKVLLNLKTPRACVLIKISIFAITELLVLESRFCSPISCKTAEHICCRKQQLSGVTVKCYLI